ncbi:MAG: hypothetical protein U0361_05145 [Nitrospiraceae bacterium]
MSMGSSHRLALFTGIELETLESQITVWKDSAEVLQAFQHVQPGSAVIIDEAQTVFRPAGTRRPARCAGSKRIGIMGWTSCS